MMGRLDHSQEQFFYSFCLDEVVPDDHIVRAIAAVLDLTWVYSELAPCYPRIGRPSVDPVLMIRMLIVGYVFGIRSERELCRDVAVNLAYRWFCGLSIEDKVPDHSVFSRARNERFCDCGIFRSIFERVVGACIGAGLVGGKGFAVDASLIVADANRQRSIRGAQWSTAIDPQTASRATKEYLATLDDEAFGAASEVRPKFVSPSDPAAQWTGAMRGPAFFRLCGQLSDRREGRHHHGCRGDPRHPPGRGWRGPDYDRAHRAALRHQARTACWRYGLRFGCQPRLASQRGQDNAAHPGHGTFSREDFHFDKERNVFICPAGKVLTTTGQLASDGETLYYRPRARDCRGCPLKPQCCPKAPVRRIPRSLYEPARDVARAVAKTEAF